MSKRALLVGCNYTATPSLQLSGCINDVIHMRNTLIDAYGYKDSNIYTLRDDDNKRLPTRTNILNYLTQLIAMSSASDMLWFHYSGHGTQVKDANRDEIDGLDECIVPCDYNKSGVINDDDLFSIIKNAKCQIVICLDSCFSGSGCDLQYSINYNNGTLIKNVNNSKLITSKNIVMLSGCRDTQTSADAYDNVAKRHVGAFTQTLLETLRVNDHNIALLPLYLNLCANLKASGFTQIPVLSSSIASPSFQFARVNTNGASMGTMTTAATSKPVSREIILSNLLLNTSSTTKSLRGLMSNIILHK